MVVSLGCDHDHDDPDGIGLRRLVPVESHGERQPGRPRVRLPFGSPGGCFVGRSGCYRPNSPNTGSKYSANSLGFSANGKWPMPSMAWNLTPGIFAAVASDNSTVHE
jgi:hypothetical protein